MTDWALFMALTTAVACGWWLGFRQKKEGRRKGEVVRPLMGLNHLIDEIPDTALNAFISALEVTPETLETHLALGAIHRRYGEVERAILIHENLIRNPDISPVQRQQAELELALDYYRAGLLDRAELGLQRLVEISDEYRHTALETLLDVYQDENEWDKAINVSNLLAEGQVPVKRYQMDRLRSHFYCEIAEQARSRGDFLTARRALGKAQFFDAQNHRSLLIEIELELELENPQQAYRLLGSLVTNSKTYPEGLLPVARRVFAVRGNNSAYHDWLESLYPKFAVPDVLVELARQKAGLFGEKNAGDFLSAEIQARPSFESLALLLSISPDSAGQVSPALRALLGVTEAAQHGFQCQSCGFEGKQWHWRCPGCKQWDSLTSNTLAVEGWS